MEDVDGEVGQKMRSAIKAKLTELGCYVDDELPDYVMVMVANKRTRSQMEDDLQLFLGDNTELFVNWLHQVLKKLQEVSATTVAKSMEMEKKPEKSSKEKKSKDKKEKSKKSDSSKKSKKKAKEKSHKKKDEKKKSKKKSKHEMIRPNIPPLLMNIEKESEPSITDIFAGQILKNHGVILETHRGEAKVIEKKPELTEIKRPAVPIIDPSTILSETPCTSKDITISPTIETITVEDKQDEMPTIESIIKETDEIEAVIEESKQKLAEQNEKADSTDDEDFLNIRTEADELINDFGDDVVFKELTQPPLIETPPLRLRKLRSPSPSPLDIIKKKDIPETLPQIELNLPKRPVRERLGAPAQKKDPVEEKEKEKHRKTTEKAAVSPERNTPELEPDIRVQSKSAKSRLGSHYDRSESHRKRSTSNDKEVSESSSKRLTSRVSVLDNRPPRVTCASVVRVRPRPRVAAPASSLLLRAVADAHKSLLNIPPKVEPEPQKVKRALVLPMRRNVDPKKIVIQVPCTESNTATDSISDNVSLGDLDSEDDDKNSKSTSDVTSKEEYTPFSITKVITNNEYVPSRTLIRRDDTLFVETINIHNTTVDKDKGTQFIVTMDGYHPNAFLAKKLMNEGLLNDDEEINNKASDKPEGSKTGVFGHIINEESKDSEKSDYITKAAVSSTESAKEPTNEIDCPIENIKDVRSILEKRKSDNFIDRPVLKKQKRDASVERPILKKQSSDNTVEKPILEKQNSDSSIEKLNIEKQKTEEVLEQVTEAQVSCITSTVEAVKEKIPSDYSTEKPRLEKRQSDVSLESLPSDGSDEKSSLVRKRKASPIIFDVNKKGKEAERVRERTVSASSDSHVILTTASNTHKYDALPPLSQATRAIPAPGPVVWCRAFPQCRYGAACAFAHPRCKFAAACTRRGCPYEHVHGTAATPLPTAPAATGSPVVASHVVPAANYKSISAGSFPNLCKYYPNCSNPTCHYYHPKPCRYGKACSNKLECNFYHLDVPGGKWKYSI